MRQDILDVAYALRREGVEIIRTQDGRFPSVVVLKPSHRLMQKAVKVTETLYGKRQERFLVREGNCTVSWF